MDDKEKDQEEVTLSGFGLWNECDPDAKVAWGARAISNGNHLDIVYDRTTWHGTKSGREKFSEKLNGPLKSAMENFSKLRMDGKLNPDESKTYILFEGSGVIIKANTRASFGHVYLIAYPTQG